MVPERWNSISPEATKFIKSLLEVDPAKRLSAQEALEHPWIAGSCAKVCADAPELRSMEEVVTALQQFRDTSKFRQCCMRMLSWCLCNEERARVRDYFVALDTSQQGTITLG